jgi:hypothetical protein
MGRDAEVVDDVDDSYPIACGSQVLNECLAEGGQATLGWRVGAKNSVGHCHVAPSLLKRGDGAAANDGR